MIKKWNDFIREFVETKNTNKSYLSAKMSEIEDLISNLNNKTEESEFIYNWDDNKGEYLVVNFSVDGLPYRYELDLNYETPFVVKGFVDNVLKFEEEASNSSPELAEEECLDMIERDIHDVLGISEKRKIPKKYLTHKPKAMKKEIEEFRGKKQYKKDWEADYDKRSGKRIKTKKSAATIAYQKKFGKKD